MSRAMPGPVRFVYFDLGKVIVDFDVSRMCRQMAEVAGVSAELVHEALYGEGLQRQYELGLISTEEFYESFCRRIGACPRPEELLHAACDIFSLNLSVVPIVCRLALMRFPIGLLSNTCEAHWQYINRRYRGVAELFRLGCASYQVHAMKPDPEIFRRAAQLAGCPPEEIFFVDDHEPNVRGAQAVGFQAVVFQGAESLADELRARGISVDY
ncbi:MAG: HAD family phosphatase [Thermoguttaceae bacterium]|nr:HAD family phosphatase [Thermoguttaceae bacterium]MDW8078541.1 HAD family phosphatase [Thermoguttaceae bacterium]